jgi:hypothetical protein
MLDSVFKVGDIIQLTGPDWEHYCSTPVANKFREVLRVDDKGIAEFVVIQHGSEGYLAWASPNKEDGLFAIVVNEKPATEAEMEAL